MINIPLIRKILWNAFLEIELFIDFYNKKVKQVKNNVKVFVLNEK